MRLVEEPLNLRCECSEYCDYETQDYYSYLRHLDGHIDDIAASDEFKCTWLNCGYKMVDFFKIKQHVYYHAFHQKLKNLGSNLLERTNLPDCVEPVSFEIPDLPDYYTCEWEDCQMSLLDYQGFLDHVRCHVNGNPKTVTKKNPESIKCLWQGEGMVLPRVGLVC